MDPATKDADPKDSSDVSTSSETSASAGSSTSAQAAKSPRPLPVMVDIDKPAKKLGTKHVSLPHSLIWVIIVSYGGFILGQKASSTITTSSYSQLLIHTAGANSFWKASKLDSLMHSSSPISTRQPGENFSVPLTTHAAPRELPTFTRSSRASFSDEEESSLARQKRLAEHAVHPVLLTVQPVPKSIVVAVDRNPRFKNLAGGNRLARDLLAEIVTYRDVSRVTVVFVENHRNGENPRGASECPNSLRDVLASAGRNDMDVECTHIDPYDDALGVSAPTHHDVSLVLAGCGQNGYSSEWEESLYARTDSVAVKCVGNTYPLDHPLRLLEDGSSHTNKNFDRIQHFFVEVPREDPNTPFFLHVSDYDVFDERGIATNFAVASRSITKGSEQWMLSEANYQVSVHQRWTSNHHNVLTFDPAEMLRIQYPSRHSAVSSCNRYKRLIEDGADDDETYCEQGLDVNLPNIPADKFYVGQSTVEHAGRGVFVSVDIEEEAYLMAEEQSQDMIFSFRAFELLEDMTSGFCLNPGYRTENESEENQNAKLLDSFHCIVGIYFDAYAYGDIPSGYPVNTGINQFTNHGCNGSANIAEEFVGGWTESTILPDDNEPDPSTYRIPKFFLQNDIYNPNFERSGHTERFDITEVELEADTELFDNYIGHGGGGDKYFLAQLMALREQCSGNAGTVLSYEGKHSVHKYDIFGSRFVMDPDQVNLRNLASAEER